jgi:tetratricopeptide (TPR) repeat protein
LRVLFQAVPNDSQVASTLATSLGFLGSALRDDGRFAEAQVSFKEGAKVLEAIPQPSSVDLYNLACNYASLSALVVPGSAPSTVADREALATRAMDMLKRSLAAGMNDFATIDHDHDLDPLRERPDFGVLILASMAKASAVNPKDTLFSLAVAARQAWFGQKKDFDATRQRILASAKGTNDAATAERAAKACSILPSTDKARLEAALALGATGVKIGRNEWTLLALGMANYRSGNHVAADEALRAAAQAGPNNSHVTGTAAFYRAMSLFQQGRKDEARKLAISIAAKMKSLPKDENNPLAGGATHDDLILWLAYKEANALVKFDQKSRAAAKSESH